MATVTITRALVRDLPALQPGCKKLRIYDDKITGFCLEKLASGSVTYWLRYTDHRRRRRETRIGRHGDITADQARKRAQELKARVALGGDPAGERERLRAVPTFAAFVADRLVPHLRETIRSHAGYEAMLRLRLVPAFGARHLDEITITDVAAFRRRLIAERLSNARTNRHLALLRSALNLALRWGLFAGRNPAQSPGMLREAPREVLLARWADVDAERHLLTVPQSKSGRRRHIQLSDAAVALLATLPRAPGQEWLFPSERRPGQPIQGVRSAWTRACLAAALPDGTRVHDLRHTFASLLINSGRSLYEVSRMLGHSQLATTGRYAHLSQQNLLEAANAVGRIAAPAGARDAQSEPRLETRP